MSPGGSAPRLGVLLACDLIDSTHLVEVLGDRRATLLFRDHDKMARDLIRRFDGLEIDRTDGFLILFDRPVHALQFALAYLDMLDQLYRETGHLLKTRIGIHLGEVIVTRNPEIDVAHGAKPLQVSGLALPTTARLMSMAGPGQILVTDSAREVALRGAKDIPELEGLVWRHHGAFHAKGIEQPLEVHEVGFPGKAPLRAPLQNEKTWFVRPAAGAGGSRTRRVLLLLVATALVGALASSGIFKPWGSGDATGQNSNALPAGSLPKRYGPKAGVTPAEQPYGYRIEPFRRVVIFEIKNPEGKPANKRGWTGEWTVPPVEGIIVAGDFSAWSGSPSGFRMHQIESGLWQCERPLDEFAPGIPHEFKFLVNDLYYIAPPPDSPNQVESGDPPYTYLNLFFIHHDK